MKNFNVAITAIMSILGVISKAMDITGKGDKLVKQIRGGKRRWVGVEFVVIVQLGHLRKRITCHRVQSEIKMDEIQEVISWLALSEKNMPKSRDKEWQ